MAYFLFTFMLLSINFVRAGHFPHVFNRLRAGRYPQRISFHHSPLRLQDRDQFFSFYENLPMRKRNGGSRHTSLFPPKVGRPFGNLFDANGMFVLTHHRDDDERLLNELLTDVVHYKADENEKALRDRKRGNVRNKMAKNLIWDRSEGGFYLEDSKQAVDGKEVMKNILRSKNNLDLEDSAPAPRLVFDFNEIVG